MNPALAPQTRRRLGAGLLLSLWLLPLRLPGAEATVLPAPSQVFSPKSVLVLYVDTASARKSEVWKTMAARLEGLSGGLPEMPGVNLPDPTQSPIFETLKNVDFEELAVVAEGSQMMKDLEGGKMGPESSFLAVTRVSKGVDTEAFLRDLFAALEKSKAGLSNTVASTRAKVGPADYFDLPGDALGEPEAQFPLGLAVGPAAEGTILGVGRADRLKDYLQGRAPGRMPDSAAKLLSKPGQMWLYVSVPPDTGGAARKGLGAGADANPMLGGMMEGLDQLRDLGLSFGFGSSALDLEVALGCASADTARQMGEGIQGFAAMMKMAAAQGGTAPAPAFLTQLKATTEGSSVRITSALTLGDLQKMMDSADLPQAKRAPQKAAPKTPAPQTDAAATPSDAVQVEVEFLELLPGESEDLRQGRMRVRNNAAQPLRELRLTYVYLDQAGRKLGEWTRRYRDPLSETIVGAKSTRDVKCPVYNVPLPTSRVRLILDEATFADGTRWAAGK